MIFQHPLSMQNGLGFALKFISYKANDMSNEQQRSGNSLRRIMGPLRNWIFFWLGAIGQNHSLGTKYLVGVRCSNYSELKALYFMGALDAAKAMFLQRKSRKSTLKMGGRGWAEKGNGLCQFTGNAEIVNLPCKQYLIFESLQVWCSREAGALLACGGRRPLGKWLECLAGWESLIPPHLCNTSMPSLLPLRYLFPPLDTSSLHEQTSNWPRFLLEIQESFIQFLTPN